MFSTAHVTIECVEEDFFDKTINPLSTEQDWCDVGPTGCIYHLIAS